MSKFTTQTTIQNSTAGANFVAPRTWTSPEDVYVNVALTLTTSVTTVDTSTLITPKVYQFRMLTGDVAEISFDNGVTYPFSISGDGDVCQLRNNLEALREVSTVTTTADSGGDLSGTYFDVEDYNGTVRVWMNIASRAEVSTIVCEADTYGSLDATYFDLEDQTGTVRVYFNMALRERTTIACLADTAGSLDETGFIVYDSNGSIGVWFDHTGAGTAPADVAAADFQIAITSVVNGDSALTVMTEVATALSGWGSWTVTDDGVDTVTIDDLSTGARTDATDSASAPSGFTITVTTNGQASSTPPATPGGGRLLPVTIVEDSTAVTIATALALAFNLDTEYSATRVTDTVTVTDLVAGARTDIVDNSTGWTLSVATSGVDAAVAPATPGGGRLLSVSAAADSSALTVAAAIAAAFNADSMFTASSDGVDLVTITDIHIGARTDIVDGTTGWVVAKVQDGAAAPVAKIRSTGTSVVAVTILPN
jgi:hypothetical protein